MKLITAIAISATMLAAQSPGGRLHTVTAVRHWSLSETTRIAIQVSGDFEFRTDRLHNPERVYFDILNSRPHIESHRFFKENLSDKLVTGVRVAETEPGVTRVVLDLTGPVEVTTSKLSSPDRLIVELRAGQAPAIPTSAPTPATPTATPAPNVSANSLPAVKAPATAPAPLPAAPVPAIVRPSTPPDLPVKAAFHAPARPQASTSGGASDSAPSGISKSDLLLAETAKAARHTSTGNTSLVRALGLKVRRVVIDPGHGGHDQGTTGPKGMLEKDLVLDIAMRVGKLVEDRMGAEVIYTRTDDTFVPLEARNQLANDKEADLFLSIHANSSPVPRIAGVETYYLNLPDSRDKDAMDVAARENASSTKSIFELQNLIQQITLNDKVTESREFASRVQQSMQSFSARYFPSARNRGVKKAPFVVLIHARMPSILAEIGFLSNPREENLLRRPDYRQKLAEALFRGVQRYAQELSHSQVAKASNEE